MPGMRDSDVVAFQGTEHWRPLIAAGSGRGWGGMMWELRALWSGMGEWEWLWQPRMRWDGGLGMAVAAQGEVGWGFGNSCGSPGHSVLGWGGTKPFLQASGESKAAPARLGSAGRTMSAGHGHPEPCQSPGTRGCDRG